MIRERALAARRRLWRSMSTLPDVSGWRFAALVGVGTLAGMALVGFAGGLYRFGSPDYAGLPLRLFSVALAPSLAEGGFFRGVLMPDRFETPRPSAWIIATAAAFTGWHPVETLFLRHASPTFLRPDFLACAAILGLGAATIRWRTASLWPAIALHWLAVVVWQTWLGGPELASLR